MPVLHPRRMLSISRVIIVLRSFWNPDYASAYGSYLRAMKEQSFLFLIELKNSHADSSTTELGEVCLAADLLKICYSVTTAWCANTNLLQLLTATAFILLVTEAAAPPNSSSSSLANSGLILHSLLLQFKHCNMYFLYLFLKILLYLYKKIRER